MKTWQERAAVRQALLAIRDQAVEHYTTLKKGEIEQPPALFTVEEPPHAEP